MAAKKKPNYTEKDFENMMNAPVWGEFKKPAKKTVKKTTTKKGK